MVCKTGQDKISICDKTETWDYIAAAGRQVPEEASPTTNCSTAPKPALPVL